MQILFKQSLVFSLLIQLNIVIFCQEFKIGSPLEIPLFLSGNFAELRNSHFHGGIDIKTQSVIGHRVVAIADGYVSKVRIQTGGYGHAIFIKHPNGYTSVYGHLQEFSPEIEEWTKREQYKQKSFEVELIPDSTQFVVKKGQFIALSGNTGRSGGPHLHLEIRNERDVPVNALKMGLKIKDTIAPKILRLFVYDNIDSQSFECGNRYAFNISGKKDKYTFAKPLPVSNSVSFGVEVYDYLNGSANKCGVYSLELKLDNNTLFESQFDEVSYEEVNYIKTYGDYSEKVLNKAGIHRMLVEPNNKLSIYKQIVNNGIIHLSDSLAHNIRIIAIDAYGNKSVLEFKIYFDRTKNLVPIHEGKILFKYSETNTFENETLKFFLKENSLYADKWFSYSTHASDSFYSDIHTFGDYLIPTKQYPLLNLKITKPLNPILPGKLLIVGIDAKGRLTSEGGTLSNEGDWITAKVSGFGTYAISADTIDPVIKPIRFKDNGWYKANDVISFKITDDLSGIKSYHGYIDDNWALFEYDSKSDSLFYKFDANIVTKKKTAHDLKLYIADERGNISTFEGKFYY